MSPRSEFATFAKLTLGGLFAGGFKLGYQLANMRISFARNPGGV
jgi:hypothetical protein